MEENNDFCILSRIDCRDKELADNAENLQSYLNDKFNHKISVEKIDDETISVVFSIKQDSSIGVKKVTESIQEAIFKFKEEIENPMSNVEFIPLEGYFVNYLKEDIKDALKQKRKLCIVDSYDNYLRFIKGKLMKLNHYCIKYDEELYVPIATYCLEGNLDKVKELVKDKLSLNEEWP